MKELITEAKRENLPKVLAFVDGQLETVDCPMLTQTSIDVAVEELFINIASYAYDMENGTAVVQVTVLEDPLSVEITFIDNGQQYDPLAREDPDITLPKQKRKSWPKRIRMSRSAPRKGRSAASGFSWRKNPWTI